MPPQQPRDTFAYNVVRPSDLLQFRVEFRGFDKQRGVPTDPLWAMAISDDSRMIVHFSFQHAHEEAVFDAPAPVYQPNEDNPANPRGAQKVTEATSKHRLPVGFAPARPTRVVFRVPRNDGVLLNTTGILAGMAKFPAVVADRAYPEPYPPEADDAADPGIPFILNPGLKARVHADRIIVTKTTAAERRFAIARDAASPTIAHDVLAAVQREAALKPVLVTSAGRSILDQLIEINLDGIHIPSLPVNPSVFNEYSSSPRDDETAIEAPYRLVISPNGWARWKHALDPVSAEDATGHVELWHTRLAYSRSSDVVDEHPGYLRIIRALWARDRDGLGNAWKAASADIPPGVLSTPDSALERPFKGSLTRADRHKLVRQTSETWRVRGVPVAPRPVRADKLHLSALGAWLDLHGVWDTRWYSGAGPGQRRAGATLRSILKWDHISPQGRDQFVRVMYPGYLYPLGHRATLVKITERKIRGTGTHRVSGVFTNPTAALYQRMFIVLGDVRRVYDLLDLPFTSVALSPIVTPDLDDPQSFGPGESMDNWFWPRRGGAPFEFTWDTTDRVHAAGKSHAPLIWVNEAFSEDFAGLDAAYDAARARMLPFDGQDVNFALPTSGGDAKMVTERILLRGRAELATSIPRMSSAEVVLPAAQRLTGLGAVPITYEEHYRVGTANADVGVWAAVVTPDAAADAAYQGHVIHSFGAPGPAEDRVIELPVLEFGPTATVPGTPKPSPKSEVGSDRGGGFVQPNLPIRALSTQQGPVGDLAQATSPDFDPVEALKGALPRLFGLVSIGTLIPSSAFENMPSVVTKAVHAAEQLASDAAEATSLAQQLAAQATGAEQAAALAAADSFGKARDRAADLLADPDPARIPEVLALVRDAATKLQLALPAATPLVRNRLTALTTALDSALSAASFLDILTALQSGIPVPGKDMTFRFDWGPELSNWPKADPILIFHDERPRFTIAIEGRIPASGGAPQFEVLGELRNFELNLLPSAPLLRVPFEHISFRSGASGKTEVDVVLGELVFQGVLSFINDIKDLIPLDGFSDPPFMEVSAQGVKAGFSLALPNLAIGVFSLSNISLGADVHVPFLGDVVTVGFNFCTREKPFVLSVCFLGGGGFFALRLSPERVELLELSLEAGAYLSVDFGVASGSISAAIGVYMRIQADAALISGFFRLRGEVDVLGLISASIELAMSIDYYPKTGKVIGRASITVKVEVLLFSGSVKIEAERQFAGSNGDPSFRDAYLEPDGTHPEWDRYLEAFAPEEVPA